MTELDLEALARDYEWTSMRFDGGDATGIIGLPLTTIVRRLAELGIAIP